MPWWTLLLLLSQEAGLEYFEKNIRPLVNARCVSCHSARSRVAFANLHLDTAAGLGAVANTKLAAALRGRDGLKRMPPAGPLPENEIAAFERWIAMGAPLPAIQASAAPGAFDLDQRRSAHWCWQPVKAVAPPAGGFAFQQPRPAAERLTLLRRVTFDLIGLPPSPDEIRNEESFAQTVDRLLASPRFGERLARRWMDLIRYSESHGSEGDPDVPEAWRYRDYLVRAFNDDVPYDQLLREHLAGDLITPRVKDQTNESLLGMAHWRMVEHGFQPVDPWEDRVKWTDNQIDVLSKAFQGLTISCARCHDHKFDAISQRDFYALFGILAAARPTQVAIDSAGVLERNQAKLAALKPRIKQALAARWREDAQAFDARQARLDDATVNWWSPLYPLYGYDNDDFGDWFRAHAALAPPRETPLFDLTQDFARWPRQGVGSPAAVSKPGEFAVEVAGDRAINGLYPAGAYSGLLSRKHGAMLSSPRFKIEKDALSFQMLGGHYAFAQLIIENYAVPRGGIYNLRFTAQRDQFGWYRWDTTFWKGFTGYVEFTTQDEVTHFIGERGQPRARDGRSWFGARQVIAHDAKQAPVNHLTAARLVAQGPVPPNRPALAARIRGLLTAAIDAWDRNELTDEQAVFLDYFVRHGLVTNDAGAFPLIAEYRRLEDEIAIPRRAPGILDEDAGDHPLLVRGDHKRPGERVPRGYLTALHGPRYSEHPRLALAHDIASAKNPLTARVMANRLWQWVFREGIVTTPDNFGKLGQPPSDPALLDWLANEFVRSGWSIKKTLRTLLLSPAYQAKDLPLRRLEAEEIRDAILAAAGTLDLTMYGPSVPVYYAHDTGSTKGDRPKGPLDGAGRRSLYLEIRRNATHPFLEVFDVYKPASTRGKRDVTNVPGQSLAFLNSPFLIEQTAKWAAQDPAIDDLYRRVLGRPATAAERDAAQSYLNDTKSKASLAQALFNLKEFVYVR